MTVTNVRRVVVEPTKYSRIIRAQTCGQDIGDMSFFMWTRDIPTITRLEVEDYLIYWGKTYRVVTSSLEGTALVLTAKEVVGSEGQQIINMVISQSVISDSVEQE